MIQFGWFKYLARAADVIFGIKLMFFPLDRSKADQIQHIKNASPWKCVCFRIHILKSQFYHEFNCIWSIIYWQRHVEVKNVLGIFHCAYRYCIFLSSGFFFAFFDGRRYHRLWYVHSHSLIPLLFLFTYMLFITLMQSKKNDKKT